MSTRYKPDGNWRVDQLIGPAVIETCDTTDIRTGRVYRAGAYRVRFTRRVLGFRGRTFTGETAWSDAERLARDADTKDRYS